MGTPGSKGNQHFSGTYETDVYDAMTGRQPGESDGLSRIRDIVTGKGAMRIVSLDVRMRMIASLLGVEFAPTVSLHDLVGSDDGEVRGCPHLRVMWDADNPDDGKWCPDCGAPISATEQPLPDGPDGNGSA